MSSNDFAISMTVHEALKILDEIQDGNIENVDTLHELGMNLFHSQQGWGGRKLVSSGHLLAKGAEAVVAGHHSIGSTHLNRGAKALASWSAKQVKANKVFDQITIGYVRPILEKWGYL